MKAGKFVRSFLFSILIAGCGALPVPAAAPTAAQDVVAAVPVVPAEVIATTTLIPLPQPQSQPVPQPSLIVAATIPIPLIPSGLPVASPNGVSLNCRGGPDLRWPVGDVLDPGENVEVVGRNTDGTWLYVKDLAVPGGLCWISAAYATVTGDVSALQVVVVTGVPQINGTPIGAITEIRMSLDPDTIDAPGCVGPSQRITIRGKMWVDGPMDFKFHFEGDDIPNLHSHHYGFSGPDIDDFADSFTPPLHAGKHRVFLVADNMDLSGLGGVAIYTINC